MIVFVHGLWLTGVESAWLRRRLAAELGQEAHCFRYHSITDSVGNVVERLHSFVLGLNAPTVHLVGHSLGGIVILRLLEKYPDIPPGRAVLLGPPIAGSCVARRIAEWKLGAMAMGHMVEEELIGTAPRRWNGARELGVIAGDKPVGLGRIVADLPFPNDGTVAVCEAELPGATESIVLPVSHTGMVFSAQVAQRTAQFLKSGSFQG